MINDRIIGCKVVQPDFGVLFDIIYRESFDAIIVRTSSIFIHEAVELIVVVFMKRGDIGVALCVNAPIVLINAYTPQKLKFRRFLLGKNVSRFAEPVTCYKGLKMEDRMSYFHQHYVILSRQK